MRESGTEVGIGASRASSAVGGSGSAYLVVREGSVWVAEYERVRRSSGSEGKVSRARYYSVGDVSRRGDEAGLGERWATSMNSPSSSASLLWRSSS